MYKIFSVTSNHFVFKYLYFFYKKYKIIYINIFIVLLYNNKIEHNSFFWTTLIFCIFLCSIFINKNNDEYKNMYILIKVSIINNIINNY